MTQYDKLRAAIDEAIKKTDFYDATINDVFGEEYLNLLQAALSFTRDMIPMDISEAPRDGSVILAFHKECIGTKQEAPFSNDYEQGIRTAFYNSAYWVTTSFSHGDGGGHNIIYPTHYTPLPDKALEKLLEVVE